MNSRRVVPVARLALCWAALAAATGGCEPTPPLGSAAGIRIEAGYAYPPAGAVAAAYVRIANRRDAADTLVTLSGPAFERGMVMSTSGGRMAGMQGLAIPGNQQVVMAPGGLHLMLEGVDSTLVPGDSLRLALGFARAGEITVVVPVLPYGEIPE